MYYSDLPHLLTAYYTLITVPGKWDLKDHYCHGNYNVLGESHKKTDDYNQEG